MRKVCPNLDREDGLDTVLEVPVPELQQEASGGVRRRSGTVKAWVRSHMEHHHRREGAAAPSGANVQLMLGVVGAPLVPQPVEARKAMAGRDIMEEPLEVSKAKYIVEQYVAAAGGEAALSAATSMYAMGKVRMTTSNGTKAKKGIGGASAVVAGGFVVWQKKPELWSLEMVVAGGTKMSAGSDGKVAWRQTPWQQAHASRGPPRTLRRCVQGLDPKSTADLFSGAVWVGEKSVDGEDCFVLRVDADTSALHARSSADVEVVWHAVWGYFSQRTGLLVRLEDSHLLCIRLETITASDGGDGESKAAAENVCWETSMESTIGDYRPVDGINVAHAGRTAVSLSRFRGTAGGEDDAGARGKKAFTCMEETWSIEEVGFNVVGLSMECFLPPRDLVVSDSKQQRRKENHVVDRNHKETAAANVSDGGCGIRAAVAKKALVPAVTGLGWFGPAKVVAVDNVDAADEWKSSMHASSR